MQELLDMISELAFYSHKRMLAHEFGVDLHELLLHGDESDDEDDAYSVDSRTEASADR